MTRKYFSMLMYVRFKEYARISKSEKVQWEIWFEEQMRIAGEHAYYLC
jgi:hypothetical protein